MAAKVFGDRMHDDVGTMADRLAQVGRCQRVVDHQRHAMFVRDRRNRLDVEHVQSRVGNRLGEDRLGLGPQRTAEIFGIVGSTKVQSMPNRANVTENCE
jgi:hypothetical protein